MANYGAIVQSLLIIAIGMYFHLHRISVIDLKYSKLPSLEPNAASTVFVFSVLCILARLRTSCWPNCLRKPSRVVVFIIELSLILYATDFLVRQFWIPALRLLDSASNFLGRFILVGNREFISKHGLPIANWIRNEGYYGARFGLALFTFVLMTEVTGVLSMIKQSVGVVGMPEEMPERSAVPLSEVFDANEYTAYMESMEETRNRSVAESKNAKRKPLRKLRTPRRKVVLNLKKSNEFYC